MKQLSIVSGTYNRLGYLKNMVYSVRASIGVGLPYEIVLVDGGSKDGTIDWCKRQSDIRLIEQGKLVGAVKAFQAGFEEARGQYVIIANDDIAFVGDTLRNAFVFMEDNPDVGIGCFYQDRGGKEWHVEHMPIVVDGKQSHGPYGQVCIVPRWLGDYVGWWGDLYHTYAGDNELSCRVYELGYKIQPVPCACIQDFVAADELRKINMGAVDYHPSTGHPDSTAWRERWTRDGLLGPNVAPKPIVDEPRIHKPRLLYAPIYEQWSAIQRVTKRGLREALSRYYHVYEFDYLADPDGLLDAASGWQPDLVLTQIHDTSLYGRETVHLLREVCPKHAKLVNWNGDYFPQNFLAKPYMEMMKRFDLATFVTVDVATDYNVANIPWAYWQIGYEVSNAEPINKTPRHDVLFLGNGHYPFRVELGRTLRSMRGVNVGIYGSWPSSIPSNGRNLYDYDAGCRLYKAAKIAISDGRPSTNFVSNRIFQSMAAGCFTLQQWFPKIEYMLGMKEGEHYVTYKETAELPDLIRHWLARDVERQAIAKRGQDFVLANCSFDQRVKELRHMLGEDK
jgi:hypothetical protein